MPTGDIEVFATELKVLNKSETPPIYIKDVLSDYSFDMIYDRNKKIVEDAEVNIDQMSIFEFIGE